MSKPKKKRKKKDIPNDVIDVPETLPRTKRVYVRKPLPPPREREGTRQAFDVALKTLSGTLKQKEISIYIYCKYILNTTVHIPTCCTPVFTYMYDA